MSVCLCVRFRLQNLQPATTTDIIQFPSSIFIITSYHWLQETINILRDVERFSCHRNKKKRHTYKGKKITKTKKREKKKGNNLENKNKKEKKNKTNLYQSPKQGTKYKRRKKRERTTDLGFSLLLIGAQGREPLEVRNRLLPPRIVTTPFSLVLIIGSDVI